MTMDHFEEIQPGLSHLTDLYDRTDLFELLNNDDVVRLSGLRDGRGFASPENVLRSTGISTRRILREGLSAIDLAVELCRQLEDQTGLALNDFTAVLVCHSHTNDAEAEQLVASLTHRFSLRSEAISGFNFGCSGFLKLLQEGLVVLADRTERDDCVALLSVETPETWHDAADRLFCGIVSAGATAAVLRRGEGMPVSSVRADDFLIAPEFRMNADPLFNHDRCDGFDFRGRPVNRCVMRMNAEPVFLNGIELMLQNLRVALTFAEAGPEERVIVVPHQPSGKLLKALIAATRTEFPRCEMLNNLWSYGNTISSSVPTILSRLPQVLSANGLQPLQTGDHVILLAAGICMTRISDHMSAGHACLRWAEPSFDNTGSQVGFSIVGTEPCRASVAIDEVQTSSN
ncbi:MAG: 3-oxoacyl-[acyl-carrier-protein] synthase III C-terminal domain-containing protein [Planctomycetota bacterium]